MGNKKNLSALVISILFLLIAFGYFLSPGLNLTGSLSDFNSKANAVKEANQLKDAYAAEVNKLRADIAEKSAERDEVEVASTRSQELFREILNTQFEGQDWSFHVPSLLIELEKRAHESSIDIAIDFGTVNQPGEPVSASGEGLKVVTAKVDVKGNYHDVKKYINSIESIDFISVEELALSRVNEGGLVGTYYINIYHLD